MKTKISYAFLTHQGKVRSKNQDGIFVNGVLRKEGTMEVSETGIQESEDFSGLYVVVDGAGGHASGEVACAMILDALPSVAERLRGVPFPEIRERLTEEFGKIQESLTNISEENSDLRTMAATLAGLWISGNEAAAFNCGDSRTYQIRGGYLSKLTHDHSRVQQLYDQGLISEDEMRVHREKNIVTAALQESGSPVEIHCSDVLKMEGRKRFFICCDGVWEALPLERIESCLDADSPDKAAEGLFAVLMETECRDNVSFILLDVTSEPLPHMTAEKMEGEK
jgi:serine/threonine protein phosphatase PrpC